MCYRKQYKAQKDFKKHNINENFQGSPYSS